MERADELPAIFPEAQVLCLGCWSPQGSQRAMDFARESTWVPPPSASGGAFPGTLAVSARRYNPSCSFRLMAQNAPTHWTCTTGPSFLEHEVGTPSQHLLLDLSLWMLQCPGDRCVTQAWPFKGFSRNQSKCFDDLSSQSHEAGVMGGGWRHSLGVKRTKLVGKTWGG